MSSQFSVPSSTARIGRERLLMKRNDLTHMRYKGRWSWDVSEHNVTSSVLLATEIVGVYRRENNNILRKTFISHVRNDFIGSVK